MHAPGRFRKADGVRGRTDAYERFVAKAMARANEASVIAFVAEPSSGRSGGCAVRLAAYFGWVPMLQYSDEQRRRFADFASVLLICRNVLRQIMEQTAMRPRPGSAAAHDVKALAERRPAVHDLVPQLIPITTETYLYAASEQIGALSALYACEELLIGPLVLGRPTVVSNRPSTGATTQEPAAQIGIQARKPVPRRQCRSRFETERSVVSIQIGEQLERWRARVRALASLSDRSSDMALEPVRQIALTQEEEAYCRSAVTRSSLWSMSCRICGWWRRGRRVAVPGRELRRLVDDVTEYAACAGLSDR
jgi:hypothetical protein